MAKVPTRGGGRLSLVKNKPARPMFIYAKDAEAGDTVSYSTAANLGRNRGHNISGWTATIKSVEHTHVGNFPIRITFENGDSQDFTEYSYLKLEP